MKRFELWEDDVNFAVRCVKTACSLARTVEGSLVSAALQKEDRSPVTVADFCVQAYVGSEISEAFPEVPLVAEESSDQLSGHQGEAILHQVAQFLAAYKTSVEVEKILSWIDHGQGKPGERFWILDPVDGTKGFLRGGQYAVALAMAERGRIQIGVLGCPSLDISAREESGFGKRSHETGGAIAVAVRGQGAWVSSLIDDDFRPLRVSDCTNAGDALMLRSYESSHTNLDQMSEIARKLKLIRNPIRLDSQAKYLLLAAGKGDLMLRLLAPGAQSYREKIWDQAAGSLVVEEAGGRITDLDGHRLDFAKGRLLSSNRGVVASNGHLHEQVLAALRSVGI